MWWAQNVFITDAARVLQKAQSIAPPAQLGSVAMLAPGSAPQGGPDLEQLKGVISNRKLTVWFIVVVVAVILSLVALWLSPKLTGRFEVGAMFCAVLWGCVFGFLILFILPPKVITAIAGMLFGGGAQNLATGQGYLTKLEDWVTAAVPTSADLSEAFIKFVVIGTVLLVGILCLPAFFRN